MDELTELSLIERQMDIEIAINKIRNSDSNAKEHTIKTLQGLYTLITNAIEGNMRAHSILKGMEDSHINYPEKYIDDQGNIFLIQGIKEKPLNYLWKVFDSKYEGSLSMGRYLKALEQYLLKLCGYKNFKIKLITN